MLQSRLTMPDLDDPSISTAASVPETSSRVLARDSPSSQSPLRSSEAEFEDWYRDHHRPFKAFAMTQCRTEGDAEDILQDAVVKLWRKLNALPTDCQVRTCIWRLAKDRYRLHENSRTDTPSPAPTESNSEMWDRLCSAANGMGEGFWHQAEPVDSSDHELVRAAVAGLTELELRVIELRYFGEHPEPSWAEIARAMGCSEYHAEKHCVNALRHLNSVLNP